MRKPVVYFQNDGRWKNMSYSAKGENTTIGRAGCGITCMAMVIASLADKNVTPIDTCKWSLEHGYKALHQGTYYTYFVPQGKVYGIKITRLNTSNIYKSTTKSAEGIRNKAIEELKVGNWIIACMGKGTWTSSGHYVLCYGVNGNVIYINDPASTKPNRVNGNLNTWKEEVKYLWKVEVIKPEKKEEDDEVVDKTKILVNGKTVTVERILKDGVNYVRLRDIDEKMGICTVDYDEEKKLPVVNSK